MGLSAFYGSVPPENKRLQVCSSLKNVTPLSAKLTLVSSFLTIFTQQDAHFGILLTVMVIVKNSWANGKVLLVGFTSHQ